MKHNGFDKYLEYQFHLSGNFYTRLFQAIELADEENLAKLSTAFPQEVEAYKTWSQVGQRQFIEKCSPDHPLLQRVAKGEAVL
jgi:hypothetical protein